MDVEKKFQFQNQQNLMGHDVGHPVKSWVRDLNRGACLLDGKGVTRGPLELKLLKKGVTVNVDKRLV